MDIEQLPKLDLHCHLDGSLTKSMIERHLGKEVAREALSVSRIAKVLQNIWRNLICLFSAFRTRRAWKKEPILLWKRSQKKR